MAVVRVPQSALADFDRGIRALGVVEVAPGDADAITSEVVAVPLFVVLSSPGPSTPPSSAITAPARALEDAGTEADPVQEKQAH